MRVEDIAAHEARFDATGVNSNGIRHNMISKSIGIPGDGSMDYIDAGLASGDESYFYKTRFAKDQIVLHFTMGQLGGDMATLARQNDHVSVPFVIGRNGTIYNLFPSFYWSYHLGPGAVGGNKERSRKTLGIELSNIGLLKPQGDELINDYGGVYCRISETAYYQRQSFRGYDYYATFTDAQYTALIVLLRYLTDRYNIARNFLAEPDRYTAGSAIQDSGGIVSHANYRATGKTDIGPAFDWQKVIGGVQA
ncbi:MAG: hypothetical protein BMS9Abin36_1950 [Gammaproteobacteria bacterium]|nr:MAG: hypothetical protein BMS9Abin36_1950 [Gammaproteobacteria bacterium]